MSKKRPYKKRRKRKPEKEPVEMPLPGASDKMMADIGRLLSQQEFGSIDEANDFLQKWLASGQPLPPPLRWRPGIRAGRRCCVR